jgi:hypothetical protein
MAHKNCNNNICSAFQSTCVHLLKNVVFCLKYMNYCHTSDRAWQHGGRIQYTYGGKYRDWHLHFSLIISSFSVCFGSTACLLLWPMLAKHHKVHIYKEYHSVCPLVGWDSPIPSLASECAPPHRTGGGGAHSPAGEGLGESQFRRLEKSLALFLLCAKHRPLSHVFPLPRVGVTKTHLGIYWGMKFRGCLDVPWIFLSISISSMHDILCTLCSCRWPTYC